MSHSRKKKERRGLEEIISLEADRYSHILFHAGLSFDIRAKSINYREEKSRTMAPERNIKDDRRRSGQKLNKKRPKRFSASAAPRSASMEIPDRFRDGDDAQEDVCAPKDRSAQYMGQSVFAMMAAAGSTTDFQSRFDDGSSSGDDNEVEGEEEEGRKRSKDARLKKGSVQATGSEDADADAERETADTQNRTRKQRKRLSERKLLKSLPKLRIRSSRGRPRSQDSKSASGSKDVASQSSTDDEVEGIRNDAPMMSRVLQAQARMKASRSPSAGQGAKESDAMVRSTKPSTLSQRLKDIFHFEDLEDIISGNTLWMKYGI